MKIKVALGVLLVSMSAAAFAQPGYPDRYRDHPHADRMAERMCFANGQSYHLGSVVRTYHRVQVCERVRGRAMWVSHNRHW